MRAAQWFWNDAICHAQFLEVLGREAQGFCSFAHFLGVFPQNRGTAFWADDGVDRVFEHRNAVGCCKCDRSAGPAFTDDHADQRDADL